MLLHVCEWLTNYICILRYIERCLFSKQSISLQCPRSVIPRETPLSWEKPPVRPATVPTTQYERSRTFSSLKWAHRMSFHRITVKHEMNAHMCPISVRRWPVCSTSTPWWRPGRHRALTLLRLRSCPTVKQSSWTTETLHKVKRERHVKHMHVIHYMMFLWLCGLGLFVFFHVLLIVELWNVVNAKRARTGQWNCV